MVRANLGIAYAKMAGKEVFVLFVSATLGAQHTECAPMELVFAQTVRNNNFYLLNLSPNLSLHFEK